jgi:hypothetical protein
MFNEVNASEKVRLRDLHGALKEKFYTGGGPLLDQAGNVVGVVTAKMNAVKMAKHTGDIPQNVNFALKASLVRDMLEIKDIDYETASSKRELKTVDIFDRAKKFTVLVECLQ